MRPVAVVPGDVQGEFLPEGDEPVGDKNQAPGALVLEGSDARLDDGEASVLADGPESEADSATAAPSPESPGGELGASIGNRVPGLLARRLEGSFQKSPHRR